MQDEPRNISFSVPLTCAAWITLAAMIRFVEEFTAQRVVGGDAADLRCRQKYRLRSLVGKPGKHGGLIAQIDCAALDRQQFHIFLRKPAHQRGPDHRSMRGNEDRFALQLKRGSCHWRPPAWQSQDRPPPSP